MMPTGNPEIRVIVTCAHVREYGRHMDHESNFEKEVEMLIGYRTSSKSLWRSEAR